MSDNAPPSERDSVIIVYRTEKRTFARVFNERSLDELKDVVRRKLGLGRETDVSLKHAGSRALLDLEDDDDFQAFCVFVKSAASVDVEVTIGTSRGVVVPPPVAPPLEQPASESTERRVLPEVDTAQEETPEPSARKRKVSFDAAALAAREKSTERRPSKTVSAAVPKPVGTEEPPKKKHKKESTKAKDVQPSPVVQGSPVKVSDAPRHKLKKSAVSDRISEAGTSASKDVATSEPVTKVQKKRKTKISSAPVDRDGTDQPISQPNEPVNEVSSQLASEKPKTTGEEDGVPMIRKIEKTKPPKGMVCASIPQTSASTSVRSEVAAAILSGFLSKPSEILPPEPPAKRKTTVKKDTKKSSTSSSALPMQNANTPANEVPSVPVGRRPEPTAATSGPPQTSELNGPRCPICLGEPFHIRYCCPTVLKGPDAIRERLEELMEGNTDDQQSLIKELERLLRDSKVTSKPSLDVALIAGAQSREVSLRSDASPPKTPTIPTNSNVSEVTVESRSEGSSSESSDEISERETRHKEVPVPRRQQTPDDESLAANDDLEAIVRGPAPRYQNVLNAIDRILGDSNSDSGSDSDSEGVRAELEEDNDEEIVRSRRRLVRQTKCSSDSVSESEASRSRSPSSSRSVEGTPNNPQPVVQGSSKHTESDKQQDGEGDVVMKDSAHPPVVDGQYEGSSEETHVGSEDRMDVDHESMEKRTAGVAGEQSSTPVLPPNKGPQESEQTSLEPASNQGDVPAPKSHNEVEVDPIEPADDLEPPTASRPLIVDPIEAPPEDIDSLFAGVAQSTPMPGVSKRIKTRNGEVLDDEAERPVLLGQMLSEATDEATPLPAKGKSRKKATETPQEPVSTRKSPRFSSLPTTSTPVAVALLNHRSKVATKTGKATKPPARRSGERSDALQNGSKDGATRSGVRGAPQGWEALAEPTSSPSLELDLDEPSMRIDELMSSSPGPEDIPKGTKGRSCKSAASGPAGRPQVKERLFDLSASQIPFPYSQQNTPAPVLLNGKEREESAGSEEERVVKASKKRASMPARYRSLSSLASSATALFSPNLPTPANKSVNDVKTAKRVVEEESSSSSSSSSEEGEGVGSGHIPRGRRAGTVLETKKRKGLLSRSKG